MMNGFWGIGSFPTRRMRRNRAFNWSRDLVRENALAVSDLVWPLFVTEEAHANSEIPSMPGVSRFSIEEAAHAVKESAALGIRCVALFPFTAPHRKNKEGSEGLNPNNVICQAIKAIKEAAPNIGLMTDVALDPYTSHGHDGVLAGQRILNDETVELLSQQAVNQASAGANIIAPSDMMDGRVGAIRRALDKNGFQDVLLVSYAAKYASAFYAPFRDAIGSQGILKGNKRTYQIDPANTDEALHEVALDLQEGADMILIKPGMPYLDICQRVKETFGMPTLAYQTSGEYAMLQMAGRASCIDLESAIMEALLSFKRAGCDGIVTYFALEAARLLNQSRH